ncbi:MAG: hypothetical protein ABIG96_01205 [Candidatus Micrarchaeota archaeon]
MRFHALMMVLLLTGVVFADGGAWILKPNGWTLHPEAQQYALIDFNDGYERLGLTVEFGATSEGTNAIWVVPVPADPTKVEIKLIDGFPVPYGSSISEDARNALNGAFLAAAGWGTFPLNIAILPLFLIGTMRGTLSSSAKNGIEGSSYYDGISIFQRVSLGGVTSDLVGTNDPAELENYLSSKGVELAGEYKMILEGYVDKDYSFVVTYISDWQKFQSSKTNTAGSTYPDYYANRVAYPYAASTPISLRIGFPSTKPYFPLKLTSMYGDRVIPITIYLMGNYVPETYSGLAGLKADYFRNGYVRNYYSPNQVTGDVEEFFRPGRQLSDLEYTKITINEKSVNFKEDLWFGSGLPFSFTLKKAIADNFLVLLLLIMIIVSSLAGIIAGRLAFKDSGLDDMHFGLYGLYGLTTMFGFLIATWLMKTASLDDKTRKTLEGKGFQVFDNRKIIYAVLYYVLFVVLIIALWAVAGWIFG